MAGAIDRRARFVTVTTFVSDEGVEIQTRGEVIGTIIEAPRGTGGFGYDPVFAPVDGDGRTFAELSPEEKHAVSHRGRALRALAERLGDLGILAR
jgi:XTP/dITP diphosphohydrolase